MIRDGGVDVHGIHIGIVQNVLILLVTFLYTERIANRIELLLVTLANGVHVGVRMVLINGNEFSSKSQTNDRNIDFLLAHKIQSIFLGCPTSSTRKSTGSVHDCTVPFDKGRSGIRPWRLWPVNRNLGKTPSNKGWKAVFWGVQTEVGLWRWVGAFWRRHSLGFAEHLGRGCHLLAKAATFFTSDGRGIRRRFVRIVPGLDQRLFWLLRVRRLEWCDHGYATVGEWSRHTRVRFLSKYVWVARLQ